MKKQVLFIVISTLFAFAIGVICGVIIENDRYDQELIKQGKEPIILRSDGLTNN